jgi:hypothetical protein
MDDVLVALGINTYFHVFGCTALDENRVASMVLRIWTRHGTWDNLMKESDPFQI